MLKYQWKRELKAAQLSEFCMQIGVMLGAGIPLVKAMEILQSGTENKQICKIYHYLELSMQKGNPFSVALKETEVFPEFFMSMFQAAEADGQMEETAKRLAIYYRKEHKIKNQIHSATLYPKVLGIVSIFVVLTVFLVVMPTVEPLFCGINLPLLTRILLSLSRFIRDSWHICLALILVLEVFKRSMIQKHSVQKWFDQVKVHIPFIGKYFRILYTARFAYSICGLYSSGFPMVEGLEITGRTIGNRYLEAQMEQVIYLVKNGESLSRAIISMDGLDTKLAPIIFVGEETGKLDEMLEGIAESYEHEAESTLNRLVSMIEPMMIIVMGLVIGVILMGIMVPMWSMYEYIM